MKKIKVLLLLILPLFTFHLIYRLYDDVSFNYTRENQTNGQCTIRGNTNQVALTISGATPDKFSDIYSDIDQLTRDKSLVVAQYYTTGENNTLIFTNVSDENTIKCMTVSNVKKYPSEFGPLDFYSTVQTNDPNQMGIVFDPFNNHIIEFYGLNSNHSIKNVNYGIRIFYDDYNDVLDFKNQLEDLYPEYSYHIADYRFNPLNHPNLNIAFIQSYEFLYSVILVFMISFINLVILSKNLKAVGVMKMNGYKTFDLFKLTVVKNILVYSVINVVFSVILYLVIFKMTNDPTQYFLINLITTQGLLLLLYCVLEIISFVIIYQYKIIYVVKNFYSNTLLINLNYIFKLIFFTALIVPMSVGFEMIAYSVTKIHNSREMKPYVSDLYTFYNIDYGSRELLNDVEISNAVYEILSVNNSAIYTSSVAYQERSITYVNNQFLNRYNIVGYDNQPLPTPEKSRLFYVFIPESKYDKFYEKTRDSFENSKLLNPGTEYEITKIPDYGKVYSYDHELFYTNGFLVNDILVAVYLEPTSEWGVTVHMDPSIEDVNAYINGFISEYNPNYKAVYHKVSDVIDNNIVIMFGFLNKYVPIQLVVLTLFVLINYETILSYTVLKEKDIAIMNTLGFSNFTIYRSLILMELAFIASYGGLAFYLTKNIVFTSSMVVLLLIIDWLFYIYLTKKKISYLVLR